MESISWVASSTPRHFKGAGPCHRSLFPPLSPKYLVSSNRSTSLRSLSLRIHERGQLYQQCVECCWCTEQHSNYESRTWELVTCLFFVDPSHLNRRLWKREMFRAIMIYTRFGSQPRTDSEKPRTRKHTPTTPRRYPNNPSIPSHTLILTAATIQCSRLTQSTAGVLPVNVR